MADAGNCLLTCGRGACSGGLSAMADAANRPLACGAWRLLGRSARHD